MTTATRTAVGTCKLGDVFIFAQLSPTDGESWMVRAGNHTIGVYDSESGAEAVARALIGDRSAEAATEPEEVENEFVAEATEVAKEVSTPKAARKR